MQNKIEAVALGIVSYIAAAGNDSTDGVIHRLIARA